MPQITGNTEEEYKSVVNECRKIFVSKNKDYGTSWRVLRPSSITDQIFIKAQRIRTIEEKQISKIDEGIENEWKGIINYCLIALIQLQTEPKKNLSEQELLYSYDNEVNNTFDLMINKNHDYGEAWRSMRPETFTDLVLMKIERTKQIENNNGLTLISEGVDANYRDMLNYAIFALIRIQNKPL